MFLSVFGRLGGSSIMAIVAPAVHIVVFDLTVKTWRTSD